MTAIRWPRRTGLVTVLAVATLLGGGTPAAAVPGGDGPGPGAVGSPGPVARSAAAEASRELAAAHGVALDTMVLAELEQQGTADFWVSLADRADLSRAHEIDDWAERGQYVYDRLVETARTSQAELTAGLAAQGVEFESFWIANTVLVRGAGQQVLDGVVAMPGIAAVQPDEPIALPDPVPAADDTARVNAVEWGIANIRADRVWDEFGARGEGIVVGNIDTGVAYTHPALVDQYRGNRGDGSFTHDYHWWDPSHVCPTDEPCDNNNHGTHTMGTMVGDDGAGNQTGVAPAAQWIAAKGCEQRNCSAAALLSSGQFMLAPTDLSGDAPRPEFRPHIVNNSWGTPGGQTFYDGVVAAWTAAGMFPVFSNGNDGPDCGTAGSPADAPGAYAVGAHDIDNQIAGFSNRGPGRDGEIKPDISAPGVQVRSAVPGGYGIGSGTSMAAPHVAGVVALMWSASDLAGDIGATRAALDASAVDTEDLTCGGTAGDNNVYGEGRLDALEATVEVAVESGVTGTVTDAGGKPLAGVTVSVSEQNRERLTDEHGRYTVRAGPGTYRVEFSRFGLVTEAVPDVVVTEDSFTAVDVDLAPAESGRIAGKVTDAVSGQGVPGATVAVLAVPVQLSATTGPDGRYEIAAVPAGTYQVGVTPPRPGPWWPAEPAAVTVRPDLTATRDVSLDPHVSGVERVSVSTTGTEGDHVSGDGASAVALSADGRYVAFHSRATNLADRPVPADGYQVFVRDRETGVTELVSAASSGDPGNGLSFKPSISADGRYVAFESTATNLVEPAPPHGGIYLHDRDTGVTELVSVNGDGDPADAIAEDPAISADGRYVEFDSAATNLVAEDSQATCPEGSRCSQVYMVDRDTGAVELISHSSDGEVGNDTGTNLGLAVITPDGRYLAWQSNATNLVDEETNPGLDIFVHDRVTGQTEWVSVLETTGSLLNQNTTPQLSADGRFVTYSRGMQPSVLHDRETGESELLTVPSEAEPSIVYATGPVISPDGRFVVFPHAALADDFATVLPDATGTFVLDRAAGKVERLIRPRDGSAAAHMATVLNLYAVGAGGRYLAGTGEDTLLPGDTNGVADVYVVDRELNPDQPRPRYAFWDLTVAPRTPLPGQPVEITVRVQNAGDAAGDQRVGLRIDGVATDPETVTLAPGERRQVTWKVRRDEGFTYRVAVGPLTGEFRVQSGTLVGAVTDANDGQPVDATVTATNGASTRTAPVRGGSYQLPNLQLGSWTVTVAARNYAPETIEVDVADDQQRLARDLVLRTGIASMAPVELTVPAGVTGTAELTVANTGSADLAWRSFAWEATTREDPSILVYTDDRFHQAPDSYLDRALGRLGLDYTRIAYRESDSDLGFADFEAALKGEDWDLVIFANEWLGNQFSPVPASVLDALDAHVADGGRLIAYARHLSETASHPLWAHLGVEYAGDSGCWSECADGTRENPPDPVHWWQPDHPVVNRPLPVPELTEWVHDSRGEGPWPIRYGNTGVRVRPLAGFEALGGATEGPTPGMASLVLGNGGRTLFRGFADGHNEADLNGNGIRDGVELWISSITQVVGLTPHRWLAAADAGSLAPGAGTRAALTVDTSQLAAGSHSATVNLVTDAGRAPQLTVPVTVTVVGCDRTITGTHQGMLTVAEGVTCLADGARVTGPVTVHPGAGLLATGASVSGPVSATGALVVDLRGARVTGPVSIRGTTGWLAVSGSQLRGSVELMDNATAPTTMVFSGNRVVGELVCTGNQPPPVNGGVPNQVTGRQTGQCADL